MPAVQELTSSPVAGINVANPSFLPLSSDIRRDLARPEDVLRPDSQSTMENI